MKVVDLHDIVSDLSIDYSEYHQSERNVINPALKGTGYTRIGNWFTGEMDSFGPLSRCVAAISPSGEKVLIVYG